MKIGDVERLTGVAAATIRYWEDRGCIKSARGDNRYRNYTQADVEQISKIKQFREIGISVADIKLWVDQLISANKLLTEHLKVLDSDANETVRLRELTQKMLEGETPDPLDDFFTENESTPEGDLLLGVDIGTTTVSAQLISVKDRRCVHTYCIEHRAQLSNEHYPDAFSADAERLCALSIGLISSAVEAYPHIVSIGVTGQMHGIVCLGNQGEILSPLYTWQNQFGLRIIAGKTVCETLLEKTGETYPTGYGLVTYYALRELGLLPPATTKIACIADAVVMKLCDNIRPACHSTHAASLGFYDVSANNFAVQTLALADIQPDLLPEIMPDYTLCGHFRGIPVAVAIGDNQAGVLASIKKGMALLNIGTSGQVCVIGEADAFALPPASASVEHRPFFDGQVLCNGSTLSGGRALAVLADLIAEIGRKLGVEVNKPDVYRLINAAAPNAVGTLEVTTTFLGTRDCPEQTGTIENITLENWTVSELSAGFCRGIIRELHTLYDRFAVSQPEKLVISGNALRKNASLRRAAEAIFGCQTVTPAYTEEAAYGAALFGAISAGVLTITEAKDMIQYIQENV